MEIFWPIFAVVFVFGGITYLFFYNLNKRVALPLVIPSEGFSIPIAYAYIGSRYWNVHNGLYPKLTLFEDGIGYRVLFTKRVKFSEIAGMQVGPFKNSFLISFNNGNRNFVAAANIDNINQLVEFLKSKNVSVINLIKT